MYETNTAQRRRNHSLRFGVPSHVSLLCLSVVIVTAQQLSSDHIHASSPRVTMVTAPRVWLTSNHVSLATGGGVVAMCSTQTFQCKIPSVNNLSVAGGGVLGVWPCPSQYQFNFSVSRFGASLLLAVVPIFLWQVGSRIVRRQSSTRSFVAAAVGVSRVHPCDVSKSHR